MTSAETAAQAVSIKQEQAVPTEVQQRSEALMAAHSKEQMIEAWRALTGTAGDTARNSKADYAGKLARFADQAAVDAALAAKAERSAPVLPQGEAAQQLAALIQSLAGGAVNEARVREIVADAVKGIKTPSVTVKVHDVRTGEVKDLGKQHAEFPRLLTMLSAGCHVWLAGPAGSGKTQAAENAAKALGLPFSFNGALDTSYKVSGFVDAQGRIVSTSFRKAWENGGLHLFDECDASLAPATLAVNAALSNSFAEFPDGMIHKHPKFLCVAAANTIGYGPTADYIGRNRMDGAFLDRFVPLQWGYDEALEREIAGNVEWVERVQHVRAKVNAKGLKVIISPRASINGAKLLAAGMSLAQVEASLLRGRMTAEQWNSLGA